MSKPNAPTKAGLVLEGIEHSYERLPVVRGLDLAVGSGEIVCLLGPSGCGKTTTLRIAAGLERQSAGRVWIGGREVAGDGVFLAPEDRRVGLMFQDYALFPHLRVIDNVAFGLVGRDRSARRLSAEALLARLDLGHLADAYPHTLSGGEQQRVALARALAPHPDAMLLDEPFSGLDQALRERVRDDTARLLKEEGVPTLLVTHDADEALLIADRIALMRAGEIVQAGAPRALYLRPASPFVARFFGAPMIFDGRARGGRVETPIGAVPTGASEGCAVRVFSRPDGVSVAPADAPGTEGWVPASIVESRLLGVTSLLTVIPDGTDLRLTIRAVDRIVPQGTQRVRIQLDPSRTFVFPASQDL